jgi:hypothetical protein
MQTRVENLAKVDDGTLRQELENLGGFFALFGATQEALKVWEVADRAPPTEHGFSIGEVRVAVSHCLDPNEPGLSAERVLEARRSFTDEGEGFQRRAKH